MKFNRKIQAFTLAEVIVALAIFSMVILSGYLVYQLISTQMHNYQKNSKQYLELTEFSRLLSNDIFESQTVELKANTLIIFSNTKKIEYIFHSAMTLRRRSFQKDTFNITIKKLDALMLNQPISQGLTDHLILEIIFSGREYYVCFYKQYSSNVLMEYEQDLAVSDHRF